MKCLSLHNYNMETNMKKVILSLLMCVMTLAASAQVLKTVDVKANLRGDLGLGAGVTIGLTNSVDFTPSLNIYFGDDFLTIDGDFHLNLPVGDSFVIYPIAGPTIAHDRWTSADPVSLNKKKHSKMYLGVNLGCGGRYTVNNSLDVFAELKYQYLFGSKGWDDTFFTVGASFPL